MPDVVSKLTFLWPLTLGGFSKAAIAERKDRPTSCFLLLCSGVSEVLARFRTGQPKRCQVGAVDLFDQAEEVMADQKALPSTTRRLEIRSRTGRMRLELGSHLW